MVKVQEPDMSGRHDKTVAQPPSTFHFPPGFEPHSMNPEGAPQHVVDFHVQPGVTISLQMGDKYRVFEGRFNLSISFRH